MELANIYEKALRGKLRFQYNGQISVEDLWDLNVNKLDEVYADLVEKAEKTKKVSLLDKKENNAEAEILEIKIEIVKRIVEVKLAEAEKAKKAKEKREKNQKILALIAEKQNNELGEKSIDELKAMMEADED